MNAISPSSLASLSPALAAPSVPLGRGVKAAREFEANLIASLLQSMEKTFATLPGEKAMAGADNYNYMATRALADGLAARGGFGIAAMISPHLAPHEGNQ